MKRLIAAALFIFALSTLAQAQTKRKSALIHTLGSIFALKLDEFNAKLQR
jgi:NAD/NADP transhydrogenase beta subunit